MFSEKFFFPVVTKALTEMIYGNGGSLCTGFGKKKDVLKKSVCSSEFIRTYKNSLESKFETVKVKITLRLRFTFYACGGSSRK